MDPREIREIIDTMQTEYRSNSDGKYIDVKVCKLCSKGNRQNADNLWKLRVYQNGAFNCFRCSAKGSWFQLKQRVQAKDVIIGDSGAADSKGQNEPDSVTSRPLPDQTKAFLFTKVSI